MTKKIKFGKIDTIVLFGGGRVLRHLAQKISKEKKYEIYVVTSKRLIIEKLNGISLADFLKRLGVKCIVTSDITNNKLVRDIITEFTIGFSFGAPWIFKQEFIDLFGGNRLLNLHSRDLPRNRGAGGASWNILNDDKEAANLIHIVDSGLDTGDIIKRQHFKFPKNCKLPFDFDEYTAQTDKQFMEGFLKDIDAHKEFTLIPQDELKSTYFPRLHTPIHGFINWEWKKDEIIRFICAFDDPYPGASTFWKGKRIFLKKVEPTKDPDTFHPFMGGIIYRKTKNGVFVAAKGGGIWIKDARDEEGKLIIDAMRAGQRLFTPHSNLDHAKNFVAVYTPDGLKK